MGHEDISQRRRFILPRRREAARAHFRHLGEVSSTPDGLLYPGTLADLPVEPQVQEPRRFEIYREDQIRLTTTRFSGGDWHWRLSDGAGKRLLDAGGYLTEDECRNAVRILRNEAALATMPDRT